MNQLDQDMADSAMGFVRREPLPMPTEPEDQTDPAPWWVVPSFGVFALILVLLGWGVAEIASAMWGVK